LHNQPLVIVKQNNGWHGDNRECKHSDPVSNPGPITMFQTYSTALLKLN